MTRCFSINLCQSRFGFRHEKQKDWSCRSGPGSAPSLWTGSDSHRNMRPELHSNQNTAGGISFTRWALRIWFPIVFILFGGAQKERPVRRVWFGLWSRSGAQKQDGEDQAGSPRLFPATSETLFGVRQRQEGRRGTLGTLVNPEPTPRRDRIIWSEWTGCSLTFRTGAPRL